MKKSSETKVKEANVPPWVTVVAPERVTNENADTDIWQTDYIAQKR